VLMARHNVAEAGLCHSMVRSSLMTPRLLRRVVSNVSPHGIKTSLPGIGLDPMAALL
jgi:hypothetical protein